MLLTVNNTGNTEDEYQAVIAGTKGPVTASLVGLNGLPTQAITLFRLPGLSSGVIRLDTSLSAFGTGVVMIQVKSLSTGAITNMPATISTVAPAVSTTTTLRLVAPPTTNRVDVVATIAAPAGTPPQAGTVDFVDKTTGRELGLEPVSGGHAELITSALSVGTHVIVASFGGVAGYVPSQAVLSVTIPAPVSLDGPLALVLGAAFWLPRAADHVGARPSTPPRSNVGPERLATTLIIGPTGVIPVVTALYNPVAHNVTLHPFTQLDLHKRYTLRVVGTGAGGVKGVAGNLLDGTNSGRAGSNYVVTVDASLLVVTNPFAPGAAAALKLAAQVRAADAGTLLWR